MATTLYLADRSDPATKLIDFTDVAGTFNPGSVKTKLVGIDAGAYQPEMGLFAPDTGDGSYRTRRRAPSVEMVIQLRSTATSQDNHRKFWNRCFAFLELPRLLVYQGEGMAEAVHIFTLGANVDQLLRGTQSNWDLIVRQFEDVQLDLVIQRQPIILLGTELLSDLNKLANPFMVFDQDGTNGALTGRPDGWSWRTTAGVLDAIPISAESTGGQADGYGFTMAGSSTRDLTQDYVGAGVAPGDVWAAQFVFEASVDITASVAIQYLNAGVLVGVETVSAALVGNGTERKLTVVSGVAPATSNQVRIKLRIQNTNAAARVVTALRRAQLEEATAASRFRASSETVPNDLATTGGRNLLFWNDGEASVPVKVTSTLDAGSNVQLAMIGKRSQFGVKGLRRIGDLQETRYVQAENSERGWTVLFTGAGYTDTSQPAIADDADASGDGGGASTNFIRTTHAASPSTSQRRFRATRTTKLDSLRGRFKVFGRFRPAPTASPPDPPVAAVPKQFAVRLKWSPSLVDPAVEDEGEVLIDTVSRTGDAAAPTLVAGFVEVELGSIELPLDPTVAVGGLALEVWSRVVLPDPPTAAKLDLDHLWLVPADASGNEDSIGSLFIEGSASEKVIGKNLQSPPLKLAADPVWVNATTQGNVKHLNDDFEAVGWGPNTGTALGVGRHRATFTLNDKLTGAARSVKIRVTDVTALSEVVVNTYAGKVPSTVVLEWTDTLGHSYQPIVAVTNYVGTPPNGGFLDVLSILYEFVSFASSTEKLHSDPNERYVAEKRDASGNLLSVIGASGELPFQADVGLNALAFRHDEIPLQYYLNRQTKKTRVPTVAFAYRPGFYEL